MRAWADHVQTLEPAEARAQIRKKLPGITPEQLASIFNGGMEWSELFALFGITEIKP